MEKNMSEQINITNEPTSTIETQPVSFDAWYSGADASVKALIDGALKERTHKANQEAKGLREGKKSVEETLAKIKARFETDEITDELLDQLQRLPIDKLSAEEKAKQLERKLKEKEQEAEKYKGEFSSMKKSIAEKARDEQVISALSKVGVKSEAIDNARKLIALDSKQDDDGNWLFGEKSINDYLIEWSKQNSYMIANPVQSGAGNNKPVNSRSSFDLEYYKNAPDEYKRAHLNEYFELMKKGKI